MKNHNKEKYQIDPKHQGLNFDELIKIDKYARMPYFELIKLLPEHQRNEIIEKDLSNLKALEKFVDKSLYYDISKNLTVKEAGESKEYLERESLVHLEITFDNLISKILNDKELEKNIIPTIQTLELLLSEIHPSPLDPKRESLIYFKERINNFILKLKTYNIPNGLTKKKQSKKVTSYVWQNNPDKELPELYNLMIDKYKLIAPETTPEQFKAVFKGQAIESINPIKWHQDNASELLYFIDKLEQSNNIAHNPKRADYQKMTACFVKPDGKPFNAAWKSLKTNIEINLSPDKQKAIDELVNNF